MSYAIKTEILRPDAERFVFEAVKTMYGGRRVAPGDTLYIFASETQGGRGLVARSLVRSVSPTPRAPGPARQTPRVGLVADRTGLARGPLGRIELRAFRDWGDGRPETELNFKFYRQATNKLVGLSDMTAAFLDGFFPSREGEAEGGP